MSDTIIYEMSSDYKLNSECVFNAVNNVDNIDDIILNEEGVNFKKGSFSGRVYFSASPFNNYGIEVVSKSMFESKFHKVMDQISASIEKTCGSLAPNKSLKSDAASGAA